MLRPTLVGMAYTPNPNAGPMFGHTGARPSAAEQRAMLQDELNSVRRAKLAIEQSMVSGAQYGQRSTTFLDIPTLEKSERSLVRRLNLIDANYEDDPDNPGELRRREKPVEATPSWTLVTEDDPGWYD